MPSRKKPAFESIDWDKVDMADLDSDLDEDENENKPVDMMQKYLDSLNPGLKLTYLLFPLCCFMHQCCECVRAFGTHDFHGVVSCRGQGAREEKGRGNVDEKAKERET